MRFLGLLARFPLAVALLSASLLGGAACASSSTPPPAVGGDDKPIKDPDQLGGKNGPMFYTADTPPPALPPAGDGTGTPNPGGPVKLETASPGARSLKLLSAGAEPREKRLYTPKVGSKETLTVTTKSTTTMSAEGQAVPGGEVILPPTTLEIGLVVKEVSDGQIKSEFVVRKATANAGAKSGQDAVEKYAASIVALRGAKGTVTTTRGGDAIAVQIDDAPGDAKRDVLRDALLTPSVPFPSEAIGEGAKWEVRQPSSGDGMRLEQTTIYELGSVAKGKGKVSLAVRMSAPEQDIEAPGAPVTPHLTKLEGSGTGSESFDLTKISSRAHTLGTSSKASITMSAMGADIAGTLSSRNETKRVGK